MVMAAIKSHQRRGIGTALVRAVEEMAGPINWAQQRYTPAGSAFVRSLLDRPADHRGSAAKE